MGKKWDITITRIGSIQVIANTQEEAMKKLENSDISDKIFWDDDWSVVDTILVVDD